MMIAGVELTPNLILFGTIAGLAAIFAVGVVAFNNPIRSALCLVANFFLLAILYFTLRAELLGITQVVVYTGAIMVLFLFVIMLLNLGVPVSNEKFDIKQPIGILLGISLFVMLASQILPGFAGGAQNLARDDYGKPEAVGKILFSQYFFQFEAISLLLLIGIVGSILLAKRKL